MREVIKNKVIIIAEAGVNHNGNINNALKMVDEVSKLDVDFIKFQTFDPESLASTNLGLANYQKKFSKKLTHREMLKKIALSKDDFIKIIKRCKKKKINFLSSPFDIKSIQLLKALNINSFKIPSGQINDIPYLEFIGSLKKKLILSTGASNAAEIKNAIKILIKKGTRKKDISLLHCTSQYPADFQNLNLKSIKLLKNKFNLPVGFSDHSIGYDASLVAIGLGAKIIEKHFTLNKKQKGPDHGFSLNIKEFSEFVKKIRKAEITLGKYLKKISRDELININFIRKKIIAKKNILKGERFTYENITTKRSESGISASKWHKVLDKKANKNYLIDDGIINI